MKNVMVCVTGQTSCERLIKTGAEIAQREQGDLFVIHVVQKGFTCLGADKEGEALEYLYNVATENGADLTVVRSDDVIGTLKHMVDKNDIDFVVMGTSLEDDDQYNMTLQFKTLMGKDIEVKVIPAKEKVQKV